MLKAVVAALALAALSSASAQQANPSYARMVVIVPKPGQLDAFEKGYERHLQWHRGRKKYSTLRRIRQTIQTSASRVNRNDNESLLE